jgi:hypothetical protein
MDRQQGDIISLLLYLQNEECKLKRDLMIIHGSQFISRLSILFIYPSIPFFLSVYVCFSLYSLYFIAREGLRTSTRRGAADRNVLNR